MRTLCDECIKSFKVYEGQMDRFPWIHCHHNLDSVIEQIREECKTCNHCPVCKDELKFNLIGSCPFYEYEINNGSFIKMRSNARGVDYFKIVNVVEVENVPLIYGRAEEKL